jgi:nitroreductase
MKNILNRKSIRRYTNRPVEDELIKQLLRAAMAAPSAVNEQSWEFVVVKDKKILNSITEIHPYAQMLKEASVAIIVWR